MNCMPFDTIHGHITDKYSNSHVVKIFNSASNILFMKIKNNWVNIERILNSTILKPQKRLIYVNYIEFLYLTFT